VADELLYEVRGAVGFVTFNRPQARNALTFAMYDGLAAICAEAPARDGVRALVIAGAGGHFAAGTDIAQFRDLTTAEDALGYEARMERVLGAVERCEAATIAALGGACAGGGGAIAACCDLRVAGSDLRFGFPIAKTLGNCLSLANYARLAALIGPARVKQLVFTGRLAGAEEALAWGLAGEIAADPVARAAELAAEVAANAPLTLRATKEALRRLARGEREDEDLVLSCYLSDDFREGIDAFLAKRPPRWTGR
jgi:enoyl-CoA hydratase/carnithine racemase